MLIWRTSAIGDAGLKALSVHTDDAAEFLQREDGRGGVVLCDRGSVPPGVREQRAVSLFSQGLHGPEAGPWIFLVGVWTPDEWREEFCAWYQCEHGPMLVECPEWKGFQFVEVPVARGCQFYVLHRLAERAALDSDERKRSRSTPWFHRLAKNEWFDGPFERVLCRRIDF